MNTRWLLALLALFAIGFVLLMAYERSSSTQTKSGLGPQSRSDQRSATIRSKPICSSPVNPNVAAPTDCIPQHLANLPPDPGPEGMRNIEGIDSDNDGVRDDVQRYIALNYGHSERAVAALRLVAKGAQQQVLFGDSVSAEEAKVIADTVVMKAVDCYSLSVPEDIRLKRAMSLVVLEVINTPERHARKDKFELKAANRVYELSRQTAVELCGYDPSKLTN